MWLGTDHRLGFTIEFVDRLCPLSQFIILWIDNPKLMNVSQQMGSAPLLQSRVMVISSIEVAYQNPAEGLFQDLIYHLLVTTSA